MRCLVCSSVGLSRSFSLYSLSCGDLSGSSALALTCPTNRVTPISTANTPPTHAANDHARPAASAPLWRGAAAFLVWGAVNTGPVLQEARGPGMALPPHVDRLRS